MVVANVAWEEASEGHGSRHAASSRLPAFRASRPPHPTPPPLQCAAASHPCPRSSGHCCPSLQAERAGGHGQRRGVLLATRTPTWLHCAASPSPPAISPHPSPPPPTNVAAPKVVKANVVGPHVAVGVCGAPLAVLCACTKRHALKAHQNAAGGVERVNECRAPMTCTPTTQRARQEASPHPHSRAPWWWADLSSVKVHGLHRRFEFSQRLVAGCTGARVSLSPERVGE